MEKQTFANSDVLEFYRTLPFNDGGSVQAQVRAIRDRNSVSVYPILPPLLGKGVSVIEVGCGTGWFSNSIVYYYQSNVIGVDFNPIAIARAKQVAQKIKLATVFEVEDLFLYQPTAKFDLAISLGVLHHTNNCLAALKKICTDFLDPGGYALIGLYHKYGRKPFLENFQVMKEQSATESEMFTRYKQLHSNIKNEKHLFSWFRDQVLHPHETQHTLAEIMPVLESSGMSLVATSINHFQSIDSLDALIAQEKQYLDIAQQKLQKNQYFPGFFVFLAQKAQSGFA